MNRDKATSLGVALSIVVCAGFWFWQSRRPPKELFDLAVDSLNTGDSAYAERVLRELHRAEGFEQHCELLHGGVALKTGHLNEALTSFSRIRPEDDLKLPALMWTGEALYGTDQLAAALGCFNRVIEDSPDDQAAIRWVAAINFDVGAMDDALRHLQRLIDLNPEDFAAHHLMGTIYFDFEKWAEAEDSFRRAYQYSTGQPARQKLGCDFARSLLKQREYSKAAVFCRDLIPDANVLTIQAECAWVAGGIQKATELLIKALAKHPDNHEANLLSGRIYLESGQPEEAIANLEAAIRVNPVDFDAHFLLTTAFRQLGRTEQAEKQFAIQESIREFRVRMAELNDKAIKNPTDRDVRLELSELCRNIGHMKLARVWKKAAQGCQNN